MGAHQFLRRQPLRKHSGAPDFQPVIEQGDTHRAPIHRVVPVHQRVDECLTNRKGRIARRINAPQAAFHKSTGYRNVLIKKAFCVPEQHEGGSGKLPVVPEFIFGDPAKTRQSDLAHGKAWTVLFAEQNGRRAGDSPVRDKFETAENNFIFLAQNTCQPFGLDRLLDGSLNFTPVQMAHFPVDGNAPIPGHCVLVAAGDVAVIFGAGHPLRGVFYPEKTAPFMCKERGFTGDGFQDDH